ncbi:hypothetical protein ABFT23_20625 [Nocardioides sp. C4-1]|uniref:hypothetical protein n=1 Tax=Nocardioides sp. C4-1 TaxID=3151851 RepID=UPI003265DF13
MSGATTRPGATGEASDVETILQAIHDDLADDAIAIDPRLADQVSPEQLATITDHLDDAPSPTFVVLYPLDSGDPFSGNPQDLLVRLDAAHPEPGTYYVLDDAYGYSGRVQFEGRTFGTPGANGREFNDVLITILDEQPATLGEGVERLAELTTYSPRDLETASDAAREARCERDPDVCSSSAEEGPGGGTTGIVVALVVAVTVLAAVAMLLRAVRRAREAGPRRERVFSLPPSAIERIREAHDRRLEQRARDEMLALGELIDATEIGARHDRASWQAALDHYDAARWALSRDEDPDVLDVVGAIVLAGRGAAALAAAERGRTWEPPLSCYLNPLHQAPTGHHRLTDADSAGRRVPVCARCLADLKAGRLPDTLDVAVDGRPAHYFDAAAEPWASTGYGALERDLVTAVQRTRR